MYVLAVNPSPPNPMGSISDDWVQDGFVDPFGCIMSIVTSSDLGEKGEAGGVCGEFDVKRICFVPQLGAYTWSPLSIMLTWPWSVATAETEGVKQ